MRCARCGNDNPEGNRFCGMCGATLLSAPVPAATAVPETQTQRAASSGTANPSPAAPAAVRPQAAEALRKAARASDDSPVISGPSFLGLNDPAPRKRASLSIDPHGPASSRNLDYLLDDEDESRHGGAGKYILILVALALAVGFGYLRWKNQGFGWLTSSGNKPTAAAPNPSTTDSSSPAPASPSITPEPQTTTAASQPATTPTQPPAESASSDGNASTPAAGATPPSPTPAATEAAKPTNTAGPSTSVKDETPSDIKEPVAPAPKPEKAEKPKPAAEESVPKEPSAATTPVKPADPVAEAQKYLYGKGAPQDCDRGMRILKPAANAANPKAMIEMGALYSAGLCAPRDLPTAYRWFALALLKDPANQSVQTDLQKLWGEMTQPERQLAIKLTQ